MNYQQHFATIISRIFDPFLVMLVVTLIAIRFSTLTPTAQIIFFLAVMVLMIGLPAGLVVFFIKKKWITDWDMSERSERPRALLALFTIETVSMFVLGRAADSSLFFYFLLFISWMVGFIVITYFWKISGHSGISALATGYVVMKFGMAWWPLLFIVALVSWSRVVRKNHTVAQVIAGALYSWSLIIAFGTFLKL